MWMSETRFASIAKDEQKKMLKDKKREVMMIKWVCKKTEFEIVRVLFKNKIVRFFVKLQLISCNNEVCVCRVSYSKS